MRALGPQDLPRLDPGLFLASAESLLRVELSERWRVLQKLLPKEPERIGPSPRLARASGGQDAADGQSYQLEATGAWREGETCQGDDQSRPTGRKGLAGEGLWESTSPASCRSDANATQSGKIGAQPVQDIPGGILWAPRRGAAGGETGGKEKTRI